MGNFSRDSYRLTNVLSQVIGGTTVTDPRPYVGVRIQQGVPLLDADLNELEDIRRGEHEALGWMWIGTGAPVGSEGFRVAKSLVANDFTINPGPFLIEGWFLYQPAVTTYLTQPRAGGQPQMPPAPNLPALPGLAPPAPGDGTRCDLVFLDAWELEVSSDDDTRLEDPNLGMPTAVRLAREWVVRVEPGVPANTAAIPPNVRAQYTGHRLAPLALLRRKENVAAIVPDDIADLRRTDLTLAAGESPLRVYDINGQLKYDWTEFADMLEQTTAMYNDLLGSDLFLNDNFNDITPAQAVIVLDAFGDIKAHCRAAASLSAARLVGTRSALDLLTKLADIQKAFYDRLKPITDAVTSRVTTSQFLEQFLVFVGDKTAQTYRGLRQTLADRALRDAIEAQMAINTFVGSRTGTGLTGRLVIVNTDSPPSDEQITVDGTYRYVYEVTSNVSDRDTFDVDAHVEHAPDWPVTVPETIDLDTNDVVTVNADVRIPAVTASTGGRLVLHVQSQRSPSISQGNNEAEILLNQLPPPTVPLSVALELPVFDGVTPIPVGRGGPVGTAGHAVNFRFKATSTGNANTAEPYTASFAFSVADKFEAVTNAALTIAGNGDFETFSRTLQATSAASTGDLADLTVTVTKDSDNTVSRSIVIKLRVQK